MDNESKKWLAIISIIITVAAILLLFLSGYDLSGFEIHKGIKIG